MKGTQRLAHRERDLNTHRQFFRSLGGSAIAHAVLILGIVLITEWGYKPKIIVPGYKVDLVTMDSLKPRSLLDTPKPADKPPVMKKKKPKKTEKKKKPALKKKKSSKAKKIIPKKKTPVKQKKKEPEAERKVKRAKQETAAPQKTIVTGGVAFPHLWYLKIIERKVREYWVTRGMDISAQRADPVVRFKIGRDGFVSGLRIERSSGSGILDDSVLKAVKSAQPFPPLPDDYKGDSLGVHFGFSYEQYD